MKKISFIFASLLMVVSLESFSKPAENNLSPVESNIADNKHTMEQFVQFINTGDTILGKEIIAPDVIFYAPTSPEPMRGFQGYVSVLDMMRGAMPDVHWDVEEMIAEGDKVMVRYTMTGTQTEPLMGIPATNKPIKVTAMNIYEIKDGKISREHGLPDMFSLLIQLGVIPMPGQQE